MRVPNKTLFDNSRYRLGGLTNDLYEANETMTSGKRINDISDDPVGISQVMNLKGTLSVMKQTATNIETGKSWLDGAQTALDSIKELVTSVKTETSKLISASSSASERQDAVERVEGILKEIVGLGNTRVNGEYIFGGTRMDKPPFTYHEDANPPSVSYDGDHEAFSIRTGGDAPLAIGRDGSTLFWNDSLSVDGTNNRIVFREDNGMGDAFSKTMEVELPEGEYTHRDLENAIANRMTEESKASGYGLVYEVRYDEASGKFSIQTDGNETGYVNSQLLWKSGGEARIDNVAVTGSLDPESLDIRLENPDAIKTQTPDSEPFTLIKNKEGSWSVKNNPGYVLPSPVEDKDGVIALDLDENGISDVEITFDATSVREGDAITFEMRPRTGDISIAEDLGFTTGDVALSPATSDEVPPVVNAIDIDASNADIDFSETDAAGVTTDITVAIPTGTYTDMDALGKAIETAMEGASANGVDYSVTYDANESRFAIREEGGTMETVALKWGTGPSAGVSSAARTLGFAAEDEVMASEKSDVSPVLFTVGSTNNRLDFVETDATGSTGMLTAIIPSGEYRSIADFEAAIEGAMNGTSLKGATYDVTYDAATRKFAIEETGGGLTDLSLNFGTGPSNGSGIGKTLGFDMSTDVTGAMRFEADSPAIQMEIGSGNDAIDFREIGLDGKPGETVSVTLPHGSHENPADAAASIETALRDASPNGVAYEVRYDETSNRFSIQGASGKTMGTEFLWNSGPNAAESVAETLGIDTGVDGALGVAESDETITRIVIDTANNKLDFVEKGAGGETCELTAEIPAGAYTSMDDLAKAVEASMESVSRERGKNADYKVTYDADTKRFSIDQTGHDLDAVTLNWGTGDNGPVTRGGTGESIGSVLGFSGNDDVLEARSGSRKAEWGLFGTLNDLMADLAGNDVEGLEKGLSRLDTDYGHLNTVHADTGIQYNRLEIQEKINTDVKLSIDKRRSSLEEADTIEAIMDLKNREMAYQAALSSTAKIMKESLINYM